MTDLLDLFVTAPRGTADLLLAELNDCGASDARERIGGVACRGTLEVAYRALWWSRVANRVLLVLARFPAADADALYAGVRALDWAAHLDVAGTLAVDAVTSRSALTHSQFVAQRTKDAIVDALRTSDGQRPSVDTVHPDLRINVYIDRDEAQVALDLGGESLHRRGYRASQGAAPLKENLAAALLLRAGWPALAAEGATLVDPMCGAGTLPIEAALIAGDVAPGLLRGADHPRWLGHDAALWQTLADEAAARRAAGLARIPAIVGYDADPAAVHNAWENVERAGLRGVVHVERRDLGDASPPTAETRAGLVICNPPYGERLQARPRMPAAWMRDPRQRAPARRSEASGGDDALAARGELEALYRELGRVLRERFAGWDAAVLTGDPSLGLVLGIKARRTHTLWNGALECRLFRLRVTAEFLEPDVPAGSERIVRALQRVAKRDAPSPGAAMFANRLRKNLQSVGRWARRAGVTCFRLYDADMPEYALAIDIYTAATAEAERWVHVQEYAAPATIDEERARARLDEALCALPEVLDVPVERIVFKRRERQRGTAQYERLAQEGNFIEVAEDGLRLLVYPVVLGAGQGLFEDGTTGTFKLIESRVFSGGVVGLIYEPARP